MMKGEPSYLHRGQLVFSKTKESFERSDIDKFRIGLFRILIRSGDKKLVLERSSSLVRWLFPFYTLWTVFSLLGFALTATGAFLLCPSLVCWPFWLFSLLSFAALLKGTFSLLTRDLAAFRVIYAVFSIVSLFSFHLLPVFRYLWIASIAGWALAGKRQKALWSASLLWLAMLTQFFLSAGAFRESNAAWLRFSGEPSGFEEEIVDTRSWEKKNFLFFLTAESPLFRLVPARIDFTFSEGKSAAWLHSSREEVACKEFSPFIAEWIGLQGFKLLQFEKGAGREIYVLSDWRARKYGLECITSAEGTYYWLQMSLVPLPADN